MLSDETSVADWLRERARSARDMTFRLRSRQARSRRLASKAKFIGVTGSSAKTTTTALLSHILEGHGQVATHMDFNGIRGLTKLVNEHAGDRDFLLAEVGVGAVGNMAPMADTLRPDIAIVTLVGLEHRAKFRNVETVALEKGGLVECVRPGGVAILNADDPLVMGMAARTAERIVTFGKNEGADFRAVDISVGFPERLGLTVTWPGGRLALRTQFVAEHFWVSVTAATAAAIELGVPPDTIAERMASFVPIRHRCGTIDVPGGPHFVVDTVKAPLYSLRLALDIVAAAHAPRRRIVLGYLSDFAGSNRKYRDAFRIGREIAEQVVFVGDHASHSEASKEEIQAGRFLALETPLAVAQHLKATAIPGELILLNGSGNLHLARVGISFPEAARWWKPICGKAQGCDACGLYRLPYEVHRGRRRWRERAMLKRILQPWKRARPTAPGAG
mgnify:CR=1 FL=1